MSDGGKGSKARPIDVPVDQFKKNWDQIFGKNKEEKKDKDEPSQ